jgi:nucleoside-diphosphate-sugar epimerase
MRILVTGGAGFIAARVSQLLLDRGDTVVGVDNLNDYYSVRLKRWRLSQLEQSKGFQFLHADVADLAPLTALFERERFDAVVNLAARAGVRASVADPWLYYQANLIGTLNLLECCRRFQVEKFLLASTSSVYGLNEVPFREDDSTDCALSPYAASKKGAEVLCYSYHHLHGLTVMVLRFFTVYGPAGRPDMSYLNFIDRISNDRPIEVYGDGTQRRDFTYVDDVADGVVKALDRGVGYEILNLGGSQPVELNLVISTVEELLGKRAQIVRGPMHPADAKATWASNEKAERLLGWHATVGLRDGLVRTVDWYRRNPGLF